jgi:hypothetical protein
VEIARFNPRFRIFRHDEPMLLAKRGDENALSIAFRPEKKSGIDQPE